MNAAHFHLLVNHLPIIFPIVGVIVMVTGWLFSAEVVKRTAFLIFFIGALTSIAAMTSGEGAEDVVENIGGVSENYIERHEEASELFSILTYILGGLSLIGLWLSFKKMQGAKLINVVVLLFALVVIYFGKETGTTGGEIRHTEIRSDFNVKAPIERQVLEREDDDD